MEDAGGRPSPMELSMRTRASGLTDRWRVRKSRISMTPSDHPARTNFFGAAWSRSSRMSRLRRSGVWRVVATSERPWERGSNAMIRRFVESPASCGVKTAAGIIQPGMRMRVSSPDPASQKWSRTPSDALKERLLGVAAVAGRERVVAARVRRPMSCR